MPCRRSGEYDRSIALMVEHRLIIRMIALMDKEVKRIEKNNVVDHSFIGAAVDFIRTYADRTHHGKEEKILFRDLANKNLSKIDKEIMDELIQEHKVGRETVAALVDASTAYQRGEKSTLSLIVRNLSKFVEFYPPHIEKEDKVFFPAAMTYFSEAEQQSMLTEFWEFDRKMIHEKYKSSVENLEL